MTPYSTGMADIGLFDEDFMDPFQSMLTTPSMMTPVNYEETPEEFKVSAEVPGYKKDEVSVDLVGNRLILKGEHNEVLFSNLGRVDRERGPVPCTSYRA
jgi:HSP20 family molecular chaperone IbpA